MRFVIVLAALMALEFSMSAESSFTPLSPVYLMNLLTFLTPQLRRQIWTILLAGVVTNAALGAPPRPNIILCMTDDQGWGDTGYNGHPYLKTPHLDRMSEEGVRFTRFYAAAAMCSPTRASVYTGRHPYRMGVTFAMKGMLEPTEIPISTVLKKADYATGHFGKWHLGTLSKLVGDQKRWGAFSETPERYYCPPWERDVDVSFVTESKVPTWDPLKDPGDLKQVELAPPATDKPYGNEYFTGPGEKVTENTVGDDSRVIMDRAIPFIRDSVEAGNPFFTVIWFHTPHSPVVGGEKYRAMYGDQPVSDQHYYATITAMDEQMGRLRAELKRLGIDQNTMLWFNSDNGPARQGSPRHVGSVGHLSGYKLSINEGGVRVPGLLVWPNGIAAPKTIDAPAITTDYFPTIMDALDIPLPTDRDYDGTSLLPIIRGERKIRDSTIGFLNKDGKESAWMDDRYKLLVKKDKSALFDIVADPGEKTDLSATHPTVEIQMQRDLAEWKARVMAELAAVPE